MSQAGITNVAGSLPPSVPTTFITDFGVPVVPAANIVRVVTPGDGTQGISTTGSGNTILIALSPSSISGSTITTGAVTGTVITFPLAALLPGVYTIDATVAGFAITGVGSPLGCGFTIVGAVRTDGATATLIPTQVVDHFEEGALSASSAVLAVSGNNILIDVLGVSDGAAGFVIHWTAFLTYTFSA